MVDPPPKLQYATPGRPDPLDQDGVLNAGCLVSLYGLVLNILALITLLGRPSVDLTWRLIASPLSVLPFQDNCFWLFAPTFQWLMLGLLLGAATRRHWAILFKVLMGLHYAAIPLTLWRSSWQLTRLGGAGTILLSAIVLIYLAGQIIMWSVFRAYSRREATFTDA